MTDIRLARQATTAQYERGLVSLDGSSVSIDVPDDGAGRHRAPGPLVGRNAHRFLVPLRPLAGRLQRGVLALLQSPYYRRPAEASYARTDGAITPASIIAEVVARYGGHADGVPRRYGPYYLGHHRSREESIGLGAGQHGIEATTVDRLVRELNEALARSASALP